MRKSDLVKRIAAEALVSPLAAQTAVDIVLSEIGEALARGERVTIGEFGTFATTRWAERVGRNLGPAKASRDRARHPCRSKRPGVSGTR